MMTGTSFTAASYNIVAFNKSNQSLLNSSMIRLASGKRFQTPSDRIPDFFRSRKLEQDIRGLRVTGRGIDVANAAAQVAELAGKTVFEDLTRMKDLIDLYYDGRSTEDDRLMFKAEFESTISRIDETIANTYYGGRKVIEATGSTPLASANLDPNDMSSVFRLEFSADQIANPTMLTLGVASQESETDALQTQMNKAGSFLATAAVYSDALATHRSLVDNKISQYQDLNESISKIDTGAEMSLMVDREIRSQSTIAMLAQANVFMGSVLKLFE